MLDSSRPFLPKSRITDALNERQTKLGLHGFRSAALAQTS